MARRLPIIICGLLVLTVALLQHSSVPLYDGVAFPDEPYRYVDPPQGKATKLAPGSDTESGQTLSGFNKDGIFLTSGEQGPQINISFAQHSFTTSPQATKVTASVKPLAPDAKIAPVGPIVGNIYQLTASSDDGSLAFTPNKVTPSYIDMRLPQGYAAPASMWYRPYSSASWQKLPTERVGNDIYEADVTGLGDYGLTAKVAAKIPSPSSKRPLLIGAAAALVIVAGVIILIRRQAAKSKPA